MSIITTNKINLVTTHALKAYPDICLNIGNKIANVDVAVSVWQGAGNQHAPRLGVHLISRYKQEFQRALLYVSVLTAHDF